MLELLLASQSPRRRELLERAGFEFAVEHVKVSEIIDENLNPSVQVSALAQRKAEAAAILPKSTKKQDNLILGADTLVVLDGKTLGKPKDFFEAVAFLRSLSGKTHSVMTGLCLIHMGSGETYVGFDETRVRFRPLTDEDIQDYVHTGEPMDKAGAYAIQGAAGRFVEDIDGSMTNVVGLPMELLERVLKEKNWYVRRR